MRFIRYVLSLLLVQGICIGHPEDPQYIYPVATFWQSGIEHMLVLKQWSLDELELCDWNLSTGSMSKILMSMYTPAAVQLLPDNSGFSFVDNGRIRIKRFEKRAVKSLDIYDPVYGIESIDWIDNKTCYFHAKSDGHYGIYTLTMEEELRAILTSSSADYTYPTIIDQTLFYIERVKPGGENIYRVAKKSLIDPDTQPQKIAEFGSRHIIMLTMQSAQGGFVIECDSTTTELQLFHYHEIIQEGLSWQVRELFTFQVPLAFFDGPARIYESILPLVPWAIGNYIYFSSYDNETQRLVVYKFNRQTKQSDLVAQGPGHLFVPVFIGNKGLSGGTLLTKFSMP